MKKVNATCSPLQGQTTSAKEDRKSLQGWTSQKRLQLVKRSKPPFPVHLPEKAAWGGKMHILGPEKRWFAGKSSVY